MKHPTPSDFIINVEESHVSVIFEPSNSDYYFGRLADPEDIARFGPLSSPSVRPGSTGDTGDYPQKMDDDNPRKAGENMARGVFRRPLAAYVRCAAHLGPAVLTPARSLPSG